MVFHEFQNEEDLSFELSLRPQNLDEFVGQNRLKENLKTWIMAAKNRNEAIDHVLFSGPPGLGKTTLAHIVANEMEAEIKETSGPAMEKPADLVGVLTNLKKGDVLFVDEIHRLGKIVEEYLYSAMEDYHVDIVLDQGPSARSIKMPLQKFTLIGATTREGLLTDPFRARFGIKERIDFYPPDELFEIIMRSADILDVKIEEEGAQIISSRSRGTPRIANRLLKRVRDVAMVHGDGIINVEMAEKGLSMLGIDGEGLEEMDRRILQTIINLQGGPVGLKTIAVTIGEEEDTIEEVYEPFLIQQCFLHKTSRGRVVTEKAYKHLGVDYKKDRHDTLF